MLLSVLISIRFHSHFSCCEVCAVWLCHKSHGIVHYEVHPFSDKHFRCPYPFLWYPHTACDKSQQVVVYLLNFSPKVTGLVMFVLHPRGVGTPIGCGSTYVLFPVPHGHELHVCSDPWSLLSSSLLCCSAYCGVSLRGSFCRQKFDCKYVRLNLKFV